MKIFTKLLALVILFAAQSAIAKNNYVRAGATGANNGSDWTNAYASLPATLVRGDTYYIADGSYAGRTFSTPVSGTTPIIVKKATLADHGIATGWSDTYGDGQAAFTSGFVFTSSYWTFDGQTGGGAVNSWVQNFGFKITETGDSSAIIKVGQGGTANNITIRHVDLQGKGSVSNSGGSASNDGLAIYGSSDVTLSYFRMVGIGRCPFFVSPRNLVVEHGWVQSYFGSAAVHSEVAEGTPDGQTVRATPEVDPRPPVALSPDVAAQDEQIAESTEVAHGEAVDPPNDIVVTHVAPETVSESQHEQDQPEGRSEVPPQS